MFDWNEKAISIVSNMCLLFIFIFSKNIFIAMKYFNKKNLNQAFNRELFVDELWKSRNCNCFQENC